MEHPFDLTQFTEEQLLKLLEETQAALLERQRVYLRQCLVEQVNQHISPSVQRVGVFRLHKDDDWTSRTKLVVLERKESEPAFGTFSARIGEVIELEFAQRRSKSSSWYIVCEDGSLKKFLKYQKDLAEAYLEGRVDLMTTIKMVDAGEVWDSVIL